MPLDAKSAMISVGDLFPVFMVIFLVLASAFNATLLKGLIYLLGLGLTLGVAFLINLLIGSRAIYFCSLISWFTLTYLFVPMIDTGQFNPYIVSILLLGCLLNMFTAWKLSSIPVSLLNVAAGMIVGILGACLWVTTLITSDNGNNRKFLFYNELISNNLVCSVPKKQTFKCSVYKNGELISSNVV